MENLPQSVALVYDRVNKWGGAERVLLALHELFPRAPLYCAVYSPSGASWAKVFPQVIPSFLQRLPFAAKHHELYPWATPLAFESLNFDRYQAVISVTSSDAKSIITKPPTFHLCYCLTPTRYLWSHYPEYRNSVFPLFRPFSLPVFSYLRSWDLVSSHRPDAYVAISRTVQNRIRQYYSLSSAVVYPPVDYKYFSQFADFGSFPDYYLYVGRLVSYKKADLVIRAFNQLNLPLVIVGTGNREKHLKNLANRNITFAGFVDQERLAHYYAGCKALIFFHEEDFGIVPLEAQSAGRPVIALNRGGAGETVVQDVTGILSDDPTVRGLVQAVRDFTRRKFAGKQIQSHAEKYSQEKFCREFAKVFTSEWKKYKNIYTF